MRRVRQNEAMRRLTGIPDEERIGQGLSAAVAGADVGEWEARMRRVLDTGRAEEGFLLSGRTLRDPDHDRRSPCPLPRCAIGPTTWSVSAPR
ncbi:hypothetical protein ACH4TX_40820 [Streptomyces sp. NPDC021098]|uniref:hypothetical protein n=1 Tax=unclassified Streptomyces TaxID=2593676 RepID=UPI0037AEACED